MPEFPANCFCMGTHKFCLSSPIINSPTRPMSSTHTSATSESHLVLSTSSMPSTDIKSLGQQLHMCTYSSFHPFIEQLTTRNFLASCIIYQFNLCICFYTIWLIPLFLYIGVDVKQLWSNNHFELGKQCHITHMSQFLSVSHSSLGWNFALKGSCNRFMKASTPWA